MSFPLQKTAHFIYCSETGLAVGTEKSEFAGCTFPFPGVSLIKDFVSAEEEAELVRLMDQDDWKLSQSGRRKQVQPMHHHLQNCFCGRWNQLQVVDGSCYPLLPLVFILLCYSTCQLCCVPITTPSPEVFFSKSPSSGGAYHARKLSSLKHHLSRESAHWRAHQVAIILARAAPRDHLPRYAGSSSPIAQIGEHWWPPDTELSGCHCTMASLGLQTFELEIHSAWISLFSSLGASHLFNKEVAGCEIFFQVKITIPFPLPSSVSPFL